MPQEACSDGTTAATFSSPPTRVRYRHRLAQGLSETLQCVLAAIHQHHLLHLLAKSPTHRTFCVLATCLLATFLLVLSSRTFSFSSLSGPPFSSPSVTQQSSFLLPRGPPEAGIGYVGWDDLLKSADDAYERNVAKRRSNQEYQRCVANLRKCTSLAMRETMLWPLYPCPMPLRIGEVGEGGKWLCNLPGLLRETSVVYSVGSDGESSFEKDMYDMFNITSHTFDPTLNATKLALITAASYIQLHKIGVTGDPNFRHAQVKLRKRMAPGGSMMHLDDVLAMLNHTYVDVLKIDCEGCEEDIMKNMSRTHERHPPFGQVLMEIHRLHVPLAELGVLLHMERMGYRLFHVEQNHECDICYELAYIHESLVQRPSRGGPP